MELSGLVEDVGVQSFSAGLDIVAPRSVGNDADLNPCEPCAQKRGKGLICGAKLKASTGLLDIVH